VEESEEHEILRRAAGGDQTAFGLIFARYQRLVFSFAYRLVGSSAIAEEISQECFLALLQAAPRFDPARGRLATFAYATVRNLARNHLRRQNPGLEEADEPVVWDTGADELLRKELREVVQRAIAALPLAQREAIVLFEYEELSLAEIAEVLNIDANAVKARLHRARANLKTMLAGYAGQPGDNHR